MLSTSDREAQAKANQHVAISSTNTTASDSASTSDARICDLTDIHQELLDVEMPIISRWITLIIFINLTLLLTTPYLVYFHPLLIPTFWSETWAFGLGVTLIGVCAALPNKNQSALPPTISLVLLTGALLAWLQPLWLNITYEQHTELWAWYLSWAAGLVWVGKTLREIYGINRVVTHLAWSVLVAATLMAGTGWIQWMGWSAYFYPFVEFVAAPQRITGNMMQANLFSNLVVLGLISSAWLWCFKKINTAVYSLVLLYFAAALALASSRAALLMLGGLAVIALWFYISAEMHRPRDGHDTLVLLKEAKKWLLVACVTLGCVNAAAPMVTALGKYRPEAALDQINALDRSMLLGMKEEGVQARLLFAEKALAMFRSDPLRGVGLGGFAWAFHEIDPQWYAGPPVMGPENNAHNIWLHLLAETGVFGAIWLLVLILAITQGVWQTARIQEINWQSKQGVVWIVALIVVELLHSLVEFPLWHTFFIAPVALAAGMISANIKSKKETNRKTIPIWKLIPVTYAMVGGLLLAMHIENFNRLQKIFQRQASGQVTAEEILQMQRTLLAPYADIGFSLALPLNEVDVGEKKRFAERVVRFYPITILVQRQILFMAIADEEPEALHLLERLKKISPKAVPSLRQMIEREQIKKTATIEKILKAID